MRLECLGIELRSRRGMNPERTHYLWCVRAVRHTSKFPGGPLKTRGSIHPSGVGGHPQLAGMKCPYPLLLVPITAAGLQGAKPLANRLM